MYVHVRRYEETHYFRQRPSSSQQTLVNIFYHTLRTQRVDRMDWWEIRRIQESYSSTLRIEICRQVTSWTHFQMVVRDFNGRDRMWWILTLMRCNIPSQMHQIYWTMMNVGQRTVSQVWTVKKMVHVSANFARIKQLTNRTCGHIISKII